MTSLIDKGSLLLLGIILLALLTLKTYSVVSILVALCFTGIHYITHNRIIHYLLFIIYGILCLYDATYLVFVPVMLYDMEKKWYYLSGIYFLGMIVHHNSLSLQGNMSLLVVCGIAILLKYRRVRYEHMSILYRSQRDQSQEVSLLLSKQNKDLIIQKEYEVRLATMSERNRIAREIHDNVGHLLSSTLIQLGAIQAICQQESLKPSLTLLQQTLKQAMESVRENVHNMKEDALDLEVEIQKIIHQYPQYQIDFYYDILELEDIELKYTLLAMIKEAFTNIYKHSNATKVILMFREQPKFYQLMIKDNGSQISLNKEGMGLKNMKERIENYWGYIHFSYENGFQIFMTIPKGEDHENNYC